MIIPLLMLWTAVVSKIFRTFDQATVVSKIFRTFDQATAPVCMTCG